MLVRLIREARAAGRSAPVTLALLIGANLIPLAGVLFLDWDVAYVLILYWLENGVVGLVNVPKILLTARNPQVQMAGPGVAYQAAFFLVHYGIFWMVHGVFVVALTSSALPGTGLDVLTAPRLAVADVALLLAALALLISHVAGFMTGYLRDRDYLRRTPGQQLFQPYPRMVVLHLTIIFGGIAIAALGQPVALVALLVALKTAVDVGLYLVDRLRRRREPATVESVA